MHVTIFSRSSEAFAWPPLKLVHAWATLPLQPSRLSLPAVCDGNLLLSSCAFHWVLWYKAGADLILNLFPNRSLLLRVLMEHQRVVTKHTQSVKRPASSAGPEFQNPSHKTPLFATFAVILIFFLLFRPAVLSETHTFVSTVRKTI